MSLETPREKFIYLAAVPIIAAVAGALITTLFSGASCQLGPDNDFIGVLRDSGLSGPEKLKALEIYQTVTDRPWSIARSLMGMLAVLTGALVFVIHSRWGR